MLVLIVSFLAVIYAAQHAFEGLAGLCATPNLFRAEVPLAGIINLGCLLQGQPQNKEGDKGKAIQPETRSSQSEPLLLQQTQQIRVCQQLRA